MSGKNRQAWGPTHVDVARTAGRTLPPAKRWVRGVRLLGYCWVLSAWFGAAAHIPHDVISALAVSPEFATDRTMATVSRGTLMLSDDAGDTWQAVRLGAYRPLRWLAYAPDFKVSRRMFALGRNYQLLESTDAGQSWQALPGSNSGKSVGKPAIAPCCSPDAGTNAHLWIIDEDGRLRARPAGGGPWSLVAFAPGKPARLWAGRGRIFVWTEARQLWTRAPDDSWRGSPPLPGAAAPRALLVSAEGTLVLGTSNGAWRRAATAQAVDGDEDVSAWTPVDAFTGAHVTSLADTADGLLLATTREDALWVSDDDGLSWRRRGFGLAHSPQATTLGAAHFSSVVATRSDTLYVGSFTGLYRSRDGGQTWTPLATLAEDTIVAFATFPVGPVTRRLAVTTYNAGLFTADLSAGGITNQRWLSGRIRRTSAIAWLHHPRQQDTHLDRDRHAEPDTHAGRDTHTESDTHAGKDWRAERDTHPRATVPRLVLGWFGRVRYSDDAGVTWHEASIRLDAHAESAETLSAASAMVPRLVTGFWQVPGTRTVFAGNRPHGLLRSDDLGEHFEHAWDANGDAVWAVVLSPQFDVDRTAYVLTDSALYRSKDALDTFQRLPLEFHTARGVLVLSPDHAHDGTAYYAGRRLWQSQDHGASWRRIPGPLHAVRVAPTGLAGGLDASGQLRMLLQTHGGPLLALRAGDDGLSVARNDLPAAETFAQIFAASRDRTPLMQFAPTGEAPGLVVGASRDKLFLSDDFGHSWRELRHTTRVPGQSKRTRMHGKWFSGADERLATGHLYLSSTPGARVVLGFRGTAIRWLCSRFPDSGTVEVALDGAVRAHLPLRVPTVAHKQRCFEAYGLRPGKHRVQLTLLPGVGARLMSHEAFEIER